MKSTIRSILLMAICLSVAAGLAACGSGDDVVVTPGTLTKASGVASKGIVSGGAVTVNALNPDGSAGKILGTATTASDGSYSVSLGFYTGNVLVTVTGGTYTDEATGTTKANGTLRAAITGAAGNVTANVTALTEVAVRHAGTLTTTHIDGSNGMVTGMLGGVDITQITPADVTNPGAFANASQMSQDYGIILAAISQMVEDASAASVDAAISGIATDLSDSQLQTTGPAITTALANFLGSAENMTGETAATTGVDESISTATTTPISTGYSSATLNGPWFITASGEPATFIIFDGNGGITKAGMFNANTAASSYTVNSGGAFTISLVESGGTINVTGTLGSATSGTATSPVAATISKVADPAECAGSWAGFVEPNSGYADSHNVSFTVGSDGAISAWTDAAGGASTNITGVSGYLFCQSPTVAGFIWSASAAPDNQIRFDATVAANQNQGLSITGSYSGDSNDDLTGKGIIVLDTL